MNELDYFVKHVLRWRDYIRYCDDFCLFGDSKSELYQARNHIQNFLERELRLVFSKSNLSPTSRGVNFIGYRHFQRFILLRRRGKVRIVRRLRNIIRTNDMSVRAISQIAAARGWLQWACSFNFRKKLFGKYSMPI